MSQLTASSALTRKNKAGLVLAAVVGLFDLGNVFDIPADDTGAPGPPTGVLVADVVLGVITLVAVFYTWRTGNRTGCRVVAGARIIDVLTALPALFVSGVPAWVVLVVALFVLLSVVTIALVLSRPAPGPATP
ncbi:hypothetical protein [Streptomyces sp. 142MFCol3.1]|uniref:hypothetical protein n=1 Tax=Streptomyces sp. 142MFCol3.1 TaxID=1172179 RepID=UPI00048CACCD|nr:hypothetical protein [Streptomyces sp. 142MFCol3.1]